MRILGIHYFAPPVAVVASRRLAGIYRAFAASSTAIHLITSEQHALRQHEAAYQHNFKLHPVAGRGLREKLFGTTATKVSAARKKNRGFRFLNHLRQSFPFLYLTDEGGPVYYRNALETGSRLIETEGITHLLSSYRPWVDHRVAAELKSRHPYVYWIADFRDLPVDKMRRDVLWPTLQRKAGQKIIKTADEVWVVSAGQAAQLAGWHNNIRVVYNGLETGPEVSTPPVTENFVINYTGSLYPDLQSVAPLAGALQTLLSAGDFATSLVPKNILLDYRGKDQASWMEWWKKALPEDTFRHQFVKISAADSVSVASAQASQQAASTNLLLTWSGQDYYGVLTAKLFDYLVAGRPITALVNGPDDHELREIIEGSKAGRVFCVGQEEELVEWLRYLLAEWRKNEGQLPWHANLKHLRTFGMEEQLKHISSR